MDYVILFLFIITITSAFLALELEKRIHAILSMGCSTISVGVLLIYVGANYVGVFHLLIYTGVLTVLFAVSANFLEKEENI